MFNKYTRKDPNSRIFRPVPASSCDWDDLKATLYPYTPQCFITTVKPNIPGEMYDSYGIFKQCLN